MQTLFPQLLQNSHARPPQPLVCIVVSSEQQPKAVLAEEGIWPQVASCPLSQEDRLPLLATYTHPVFTEYTFKLPGMQLWWNQNGFLAAGADPALWHRALQPGSHSWAEQHHPELSRCSWGALHLFAFWGRTGNYRGSVKPFAVKPTGLICPFELAGWAQMQLALCDLVKEGVRNIICKGVMIWETQAMLLFQSVSKLTLHLQFRKSVIPR